MSSIEPSNAGGAGALTPTGAATASTTPESATNLGDILERVLDKGVVIAGDIQVNLLDIELLTIKLRLIIASVDTARRMGIRWWETDPMLAGGDQGEDSRSLRERVRRLERQLQQGSEGDRAPAEGDVENENRALREEVKRLERRLERVSRSEQSGDD